MHLEDVGHGCWSGCWSRMFVTDVCHGCWSRMLVRCWLRMLVTDVASLTGQVNKYVSTRSRCRLCRPRERGTVVGGACTSLDLRGRGKTEYFALRAGTRLVGYGSTIPRCSEVQ
jgi:hypothetical protein